MIRPGIRRLFRLGVRRTTIVNRDVSDEIEMHLALRAEQLVHMGWEPDAARLEAARRLGSLGSTGKGLRTHAHQRERSMHIREWKTDLWADVRYALRALRREPGFSAFSIVTLALGIGVNAAMFSVVDRLMLRGPSHVRDVGQLRRLQIARQEAGRPLLREGRFGYVAYDAIRHNTSSFAAVAAYSVRPEGVLLGRGAEARRINLGEATAGLFPLLGVQPAAGRFFTEKEDDTLAPERVVVLAYAFARQQFGATADAVGKSLTLDNAEHVVIGVAPRGFTGPDLTRVDVWMPESIFGQRTTNNWTRNWNSSWLSLVVRLKPDVTTERADADATAAFRAAYVGSDESKRQATVAVKPLQFTPEGDEPVESRISKWLLGVAACVLLIACANVINLQLARALRRQRELAVRLTLGAGRARLVRLLVTESLVLAVAGGVVSVAVAGGLGAVMRSRLIPNVEWDSALVDSRVIGVALIVALLVGMAVGLVPALRASTPDLAAAMKAGVREGGGRTGRLRATLTVAQAALSVVLLVGAGLFVQSLRHVRALDLGLQPDRVLAFSVSRAGVGTIADTAERRREAERRAAYFESAVAELRRRPDVEYASVTIGLAFGGGFGDHIRVPGRDSIPVLKGGGPYLAAVTSDYFATMGTRILRGRAFTAEDRKGSAPVSIINETMAAALWPHEDPIGKCFYVAESTACAEVVGIAANAKQFQLREGEAMSFYLPYGQQVGISGSRIIVRPHGDARRLIGDVRKQLLALDPSILFVRADLLQDLVDPQIRPWRLGATMFTLMGVLALVVAAVGLYSVMSYLVAHRRQEIGVRIALGAQSRDVVRLIVRGGAILAFAGVAIGLGLSVVVAGRVAPLLFDTSPRDPVVYGVVALALFAAAMVASAAPAVRASRVNPLDAMRVE